jgi:hypothetical protein
MRAYREEGVRKVRIPEMDYFEFAISYTQVEKIVWRND